MPRTWKATNTPEPWKYLRTILTYTRYSVKNVLQHIHIGHWTVPLNYSRFPTFTPCLYQIPKPWHWGGSGSWIIFPLYASHYGWILFRGEKKCHYCGLSLPPAICFFGLRATFLQTVLKKWVSPCRLKRGTIGKQSSTPLEGTMNIWYGLTNTLAIFQALMN